MNVDVDYKQILRVSTIFAILPDLVVCNGNVLLELLPPGNTSFSRSCLEQTRYLFVASLKDLDHRVETDGWSEVWRYAFSSGSTDCVHYCDNRNVLLLSSSDDRMARLGTILLPVLHFIVVCVDCVSTCVFLEHPLVVF